MCELDYLLARFSSLFFFSSLFTHPIKLARYKRHVMGVSEYFFLFTPVSEKGLCLRLTLHVMCARVVLEGYSARDVREGCAWGLLCTWWARGLCLRFTMHVMCARVVLEGYSARDVREGCAWGLLCTWCARGVCRITLCQLLIINSKANNIFVCRRERL